VTESECKQLKRGTLIIGLYSGEIAIVDEVSTNHPFAPKDLAIRHANTWLKYNTWRKMTKAEIENLYIKAMENI